MITDQIGLHSVLLPLLTIIVIVVVVVIVIMFNSLMGKFELNLPLLPLLFSFPVSSGKNEYG